MTPEKNKLIEIYVPACAESYDILVPVRGEAAIVVSLIASAVSELSDGRFRASDDALLCDPHTGAIIDTSGDIHELKIENADRFLLI